MLNIASIFPVVTLARKKNRRVDKSDTRDGRKHWRPTKKEAQDAFVVIVPVS